MKIFKYLRLENKTHYPDASAPGGVDVGGVGVGMVGGVGVGMVVGVGVGIVVGVGVAVVVGGDDADG